jgi:IS605 OrfB family transposase
MVKKKKEDINLKTYTFYIKDVKKTKILLSMSKISKNVYNTTLFIYKLYKLYKNKIFEELYNFIKNLKKENKKIDNEECVTKYYEIFNKYYKYHCDNKDEINKLNNELFKKIKNKIEDKKYIITNKNYKKYINAFIDYANEKYKNTKLNVEHSVENIIRSFYIKNYFYVEQLFSNNKLTDDDKIKYIDLINFIKDKNGVFDFNDNNDTFKQKISDEFDIKLKSTQNLLSRIIYKNLGDNLKKLPSDVIINIINKVFDGISSYYGLIKSRKQSNVNFLKYKKEDETYNLFYYERSFKILDEGVRLNVGEYINENYNKITDTNYETIIIGKKTRYNYSKNNLVNSIKNKPKKNFIKVDNKFINKKDLISTNYLYISKNIKIKDKKIKLIELKPDYNKIKVCITYEDNKIEQFDEDKFNKLSEQEKINKSISIDLGMKNLLTIYDPTGNQHIIKGNSIISLNNFYNKKINKLKSINKKKYNKNTFNRLQSLLKERENKINGFFNRVVNKIMETYKNKEQIIIGYNAGWKTKVNMGKNNNRRFYEIPYKKLIYKFFQKAEKLKKKITITKESYTSKCDSLNLEKINYHEKYDGERLKRGLFSSKTKKLINADLNGAINIMRKKLNLLVVKGLNLFNPTILKP